jgi:hypothetical protein
VLFRRAGPREQKRTKGLGVQGAGGGSTPPSPGGVSLIALLGWGRFFCPLLARVSGVFGVLQPLGLRSFLFPWVRSSSGWCSPAEDFTGFGLGNNFLVCFYGGVSNLVFLCFGFFLSLESDLLILVGFSKTRASPRWSPASFDPAASSHGRVSSSSSARGLQAPGRSIFGPARVGHGLSSRAQLVVFRWIRGLPVDFCCRGGLRWQRVFYTCRCRRRRHPTPIPVLASVKGFFFFFFFFFFFLSFLSFHSLPPWCLNVTGSFIGLGARSAIFYLLIVLKYKEWLSVVPVMVNYVLLWFAVQVRLIIWLRV